VQRTYDMNFQLTAQHLLLRVSQTGYTQTQWVVMTVTMVFPSFIKSEQCANIIKKQNSVVLIHIMILHIQYI